MDRHSLPRPFRCTVRHEGLGATWVRASGELDIAGSAEFAQVLEDALASAQLVVLDLHDLDFIDASGLHVIEDTSVQALLDGRRLVVALAPATVTRLFSLTGMADSLELLDLDSVAISGPEAEGPVEARG